LIAVRLAARISDVPPGQVAVGTAHDEVALGVD
jgi:hypothetical protein